MFSKFKVIIGFSFFAIAMAIVFNNCSDMNFQSNGVAMKSSVSGSGSGDGASGAAGGGAGDAADASTCEAGTVGCYALCHVPPGDPAALHTIYIGQPAVQAHLEQHSGDYVGACK